MLKHVLYRVVGVLDDGKRLVLVTHITMDRAQALIDALDGISAFRSALIEPQPISSGEVEIANACRGHSERALSGP